MPVPRISQAEGEVMHILWADAPLAANQVVARLRGRKDWSPRTIKTLLNRLVKKGALAFAVQGNRYLYRPKVQRQEYVQVESRSFLARVFGGAVGPMLLHFVNSADLSPEEIAQLKRILAKKEK